MPLRTVSIYNSSSLNSYLYLLAKREVAFSQKGENNIKVVLGGFKDLFSNCNSNF